MLREKDGKEMRHEKEMFRENATRDAKGNRFTGVQANCVCRISTIGRYPCQCTASVMSVVSHAQFKPVTLAAFRPKSFHR